MTDDAITSQLVTWYFDDAIEFWHEKRMSRMEAWKYHEKLLMEGNIITLADGNTLCGYVESLRLSFDQWGRIICGEPFSAYLEDVKSGPIAVCYNTYIRPEYRNTEVYRILRNKFIELNKNCRYFAGEARRKRAGFIKVFKRQEILKEA